MEKECVFHDTFVISPENIFSYCKYSILIVSSNLEAAHSPGGEELHSLPHVELPRGAAASRVPAVSNCRLVLAFLVA